MEQAELESKIKQIMFPNDLLAQKYTITESNVAIERLLEMVLFFETTDEANINDVVDNFLHPERFDNPPNVIHPKPVEKTNVEKVNASIPQSKPAKPTSKQIKSQIDSQFKKDHEGNFINMEGVYEKLNELAEKNNDPSILELYYFDEGAGKFKWKE